MRIRSIKPEYWAHAMHERLSREASILGAALQNFADDEGRGEAVPTKIQGQLVPFITMDVKKALEELAGVTFLVLYTAEIDGVTRRLFQIVTFARHQSINRPTPSVLPAPPGWVFRLDPKPDNWDAQKRWRSGRWYREINGAGPAPGGLSESAVRTHAGRNEDSRDGQVAAHSVAAELVREDSQGNEGRSEIGMKEGVSERARTSLVDDSAGNVEQLNVEQLNVEQFSGKAADGKPEARAPQAAREARALPEGPEAVIPTLEEVVAAGTRCVPAAAPRGYCEWWFRKFPSSMGGWLRRGFLVDWPWELGDWWRRDQRAFEAGTHASCAAGNGEPPKGGTTYLVKNGAAVVPGWVRLKELESQEGPIWTHPANRESVFYEKRRAGLAARKELGKLIAERDALRAEARK
jgi:hypothetical protein